jgi:hypothetical protein
VELCPLTKWKLFEKTVEKLWGAETAHRLLLMHTKNDAVFQLFLPEVIGASIEHGMRPILFDLFFGIVG